jgi:hypothetical protein
VEVRYGRNNPGSIPRWSKLLVDFLKNPLAGETGVQGFSMLGEGFFFLIKTVGAVFVDNPYKKYLIVIISRMRGGYNKLHAHFMY